MFYLRVLDYIKWVPANRGSALRDIYWGVHQNHDNCFFWSKCVYLPFKHQNILVFWSSCVNNFFHLKGESLSWPLVIDLWEPSILYLIHLPLSLLFFVISFCLCVCLFVFFYCYNFFVLQLWRKNNMVIKLFFLLLFCLVSIIQTECGLFKKLGKAR